MTYLAESDMHMHKAMRLCILFALDVSWSKGEEGERMKTLREKKKDLKYETFN